MKYAPRAIASEGAPQRRSGGCRVAKPPPGGHTGQLPRRPLIPRRVSPCPATDPPNVPAAQSYTAARSRPSPLPHSTHSDAGGGKRRSAAHRSAADRCTYTAPGAARPSIRAAIVTASP